MNSLKKYASNIELANQVEALTKRTEALARFIEVLMRRTDTLAMPVGRRPLPIVKDELLDDIVEIVASKSMDEYL
jgi:hypothetical protein